MGVSEFFKSKASLLRRHEQQHHPLLRRLSPTVLTTDGTRNSRSRWRENPSTIAHRGRRMVPPLIPVPGEVTHTSGQHQLVERSCTVVM